MIGFFPEIYPDELIYSWFARYYARSGYAAYIEAIRDIYGYGSVRPDVELINKLSEDAKQIVLHGMSLHCLIMDHTMFPYYARFMPLNRRRKAYEGIMNADTDIHDLLAIPTGRGEKRYVRYCPKCAEENRERYGETYIHRMHQMIFVDICHKHHCYLEQTAIPIMGKSSPRLYSIDTLIGNLTIRITDNETEIRLAEYVSEVFYAEMDMDNPIMAGDFLHARMAGTPYRSVRGQQRKMRLLYEDYCDYYHDNLNKGAVEMWHLQKILNGYRYSTYEICQLAMFLGVAADELVKMRLPEKSQEQIFDENVKSLRKKGYSYPKIAKEMGASVDIIKLIGRGKYLSEKKEDSHNRSGGVKGYDWDRIDEETLTLVDMAVKEIYCVKGGRPHRVSIHSVEKKLNLKEGRLERMKKCKGLIDQYSESRQHYWAREVIWAVNEIEDSGKALNWKRIREITNMKKSDLSACLADLQVMDKDVWKKVSSLI